VLETKYLVVIGHSLRDWNFLQACEGTVLRDTGPKGIYVVDPSPSEDTIEFWRKRHATFIRLSAEAFLERLYAKVSGFADRKDELKLADPAIVPSERTRVVEFYGPPGIGKTVLLEEIASRHKAQGIQPILIDFGEREYQYKKKGCQYIRAFIADSLGIENTDSDDKLVKSLADKKIILLFDRTEKASSGLLEDWLAPLILKLLDTCDVRVVFAGRTQLSWRRPFGFKSRVRPERLQPFTVDWTKDQITGSWPSGEELCRDIHGLSYGHPLCNRYLIDYLREADADRDWIKRNRDRLVKRLVRDVIRRTIMKGLSKDAVAAIEMICCFRVFDEGMLRDVLLEFLPDRFGGYQTKDYHELWANLRTTNLIEYDPSQKGYCIDIALRKLLARNTQLSKRDQYVEFHESAARHYDDVVRKGETWRFREKLYHLASAGRVRDVLAQELATYLEKSCQDINDARVFKEELDWDREFAEDMPEICNCLLETVDRFLESLESR
jgi:DNA polymerase III delta prime subunit